ncbi:MAG: hypothetical protein U0794_04030 [Isosphaeraceae bacterium]
MMGYVGLPLTFNITRRSSGPPNLSPYTNFNISYPAGYTFIHSLIPI